REGDPLAVRQDEIHHRRGLGRVVVQPEIVIVTGGGAEGSGLGGQRAIGADNRNATAARPRHGEIGIRHHVQTGGRIYGPGTDRAGAAPWRRRAHGRRRRLHRPVPYHLREALAQAAGGRGG